LLPTGAYNEKGPWAKCAREGPLNSVWYALALDHGAVAFVILTVTAS
jgi:hypothetical protein